MQEDINQKIENLRKKGEGQGERKKIYMIIGIALLVFFAGSVVAAAYYFWDDIISLKTLNDYGNTEVIKIKEDRDYYEILEDECHENSCCLASFRRMRDNNYTKCENAECEEGFLCNRLKCSESYAWCEPIREESEEDILKKSLDSDGDGLSDYDEEEFGTNPHDHDTDGDGYSDGDEVRSGHSPLGEGEYL